jgi:hypothetical protein
MIQHQSSAPRSKRTTRITWRAPESGRRGTLRCLPLVAAATVVLVFVGAFSAGAGGALAATTPTTPSTTTTPTTTTPPSLNSASDHLALTAYKSYIQALVLNANLGRQRDAALVSTIASSCQNALSQLRGEPSTPVRQAVLANFGEEIGGDLALAFLSEAKRPFAQLSAALAGLPWSYRAPAYAIRQLLRAEKTVLRMPPSDLCANASQVSSYPRVIPIATQSFLSGYLAASANVSSRFHNFLTVLQSHETKADRPLVAEIDTLVAQFSAASTSAEQTYSQSVMSELGLVG